MTKIKYDKALDNDKELAETAKFYDTADLSDYFDANDKNKKININISNSNYNLAQKIGAFTGTGYQNALKMAMSIGLSQLLEDLKIKKGKVK